MCAYLQIFQKISVAYIFRVLGFIPVSRHIPTKIIAPKHIKAIKYKAPERVFICPQVCRSKDR